jgi:hypothetical protein
MILLCDECRHPGIFHPIQPTIVGHLHGQPVHRNLCNTCAANAKRRLTRRAVSQQAQAVLQRIDAKWRINE